MSDLANDPDATRRILLVAGLAFALAGCGRGAAPAKPPTVSTDRLALGRLIRLPAGVTHAEWQTGPMAEHGGDWWVAAVLDVPAAQMSQCLPGPATADSLDTPPGMLTTASFAALKALPGATPVAGDRLHLPGDVHGSAPFASSPLLQGHALRLSPTRVFVLLWTT